VEECLAEQRIAAGSGAGVALADRGVEFDDVLPLSRARVADLPPLRIPMEGASY
jgi:hypothetical protein